MHSTHAAKLKKLLETMEQLGFTSIGVWLSDSVGRNNLHIKVEMALLENKPKRKET